MATPLARGGAGATTAVALLLLPLLLSPSLALDEAVHLLEFKESQKSASALDATWLPGTDPCDLARPWRGVECSKSADGPRGRRRTVSSLLLMNCGLSGSATDVDVDALSSIESLRVLSLENNSFTSPLPDFGRLASLRSLFLSGNAFSGEIPRAYFDNMDHLKKVHLSRNRFSGKIPESLARLGSVIEILLQHNEFSGPVPNFGQKSLHTIDLSYNKLQGEIPQNLSRFPAEAFQGNPDLCGAVVSKECRNLAAHRAEESHKTNTITKWAFLAIVVTVLLVTILFRVKKDQDVNFTVIAKEQGGGAVADEQAVAVQVNVPSLTRKVSTSSSRRKTNPYNDGGSQCTSKRACSVKPLNDLVIINEEKGVFGLLDLMKAAAEVLGNSGLGSAYKATMANGMSVVVKRAKDTNDLSKDEFETKIRKLGRVRHRNILPLLAFYYQKEEKLFVTEYIPGGSLLNLLHGDSGGNQPGAITWPTRLKIIKGVARGMGFLHTEFSTSELPHGNLKSNNVLLSPNYDSLLTDYALHGLIGNALPSLSACKAPETSAAAENWQISHKCDVYCLGVVILEILTRKLPAQSDVILLAHQALSSGRLLEIVDPEIANSVEEESRSQMEKMVRIGAACTESDPVVRIEMREAIRCIEEIEI